MKVQIILQFSSSHQRVMPVKISLDEKLLEAIRSSNRALLRDKKVNLASEMQ